jgi:hypothetical protein
MHGNKLLVVHGRLREVRGFTESPPTTILIRSIHRSPIYVHPAAKNKGHYGSSAATGGVDAQDDAGRRPPGPPESSMMDLDDGGGGGGNVVPLQQQQHYPWRTLAPAAPAGHGDQEEACRGVPPARRRTRAPRCGAWRTSCWSCCRQGPSWWGTPSTATSSLDDL